LLKLRMKLKRLEMLWRRPNTKRNSMMPRRKERRSLRSSANAKSLELKLKPDGMLPRQMPLQPVLLTPRSRKPRPLLPEPELMPRKPSRPRPPD
jgi:hypothetical protein